MNGSYSTNATINATLALPDPGSLRCAGGVEVCGEGEGREREGCPSRIQFLGAVSVDLVSWFRGGGQIAVSHGPRDCPGTRGVLPCLPDLSCVRRLPRSQLRLRQSQTLPCCPPPLPAHPSSRFVQNFGLGSVVVAPGLSPPDFSVSATGGCQGHRQPQSEPQASASGTKRGGNSHNGRHPQQHILPPLASSC